MYALAVLSRRGRGHVVALGLLAVVCRDVAEVKRREVRAAALAGWRGRVALEFADYLATAPGPVFSASRKKYVGHRFAVAGTGHPYVYGVGGHLDAPGWILAGAMVWIENFGECPKVARREGEL